MLKTKPTVPSMRIGKRIPPEQFNLPVGYSPDGARMVTFGEIAHRPPPAMLSLPQMTPAQRAALVARRIELQPKFQIVMIGAGIIDKTRAIAEVKAQSEIGRALIEVEEHLLNHLMEQLTRAH